MSLRLALTILVLLAAAAFVVVRRDTAAPAAAAGPTTATAPGAAGPVAATAKAAATPAPPAAPLDPASIRDVFRYAQPPPAPRPAARTAAPAPEPTPALDPFRLVGLVHREGRRLAAFSLAGDVVLAGEGELVGGALVLEVSDEVVRLRRPDGSESRLTLP